MKRLAAVIAVVALVVAPLAAYADISGRYACRAWAHSNRYGWY
jgi:hypothetical protein